MVWIAASIAVRGGKLVVMNMGSLACPRLALNTSGGHVDSANIVAIDGVILGATAVIATNNRNWFASAV